MKVELDVHNNDVSALVPLTEFSYENIFKVFQDDVFYSYNILRKVTIPDDLDETFFDYVTIPARMAWTLISYKEYGTILLWWLICATNKISNPVFLPDAGTVVKIIKPQFVRLVLDQIKTQLSE